MKRFVNKAVLLVVLFVSITVISGCQEGVTVFQVNDVVSDPGAFSKPLTLEGVVYQHAKGDATIVGVMDKKELQCKTPNCNKALMAVKVTGTSLSIGDEVKVSGTIVKERWGYLFKADQVKVVANHKFGV
ncbi:MAG: hypothetical protein RQ754_03615 [Desulfuromonadales bacterium]|nr:hypothetical protein [Desulfuromonadales bacterium]